MALVECAFCPCDPLGLPFPRSDERSLSLSKSLALSLSLYAKALGSKEDLVQHVQGGSQGSSLREASALLKYFIILEGRKIPPILTQSQAG